MKLLAKEFRLCTHPTVFIMLGLSAMVLIPNYPYAVSYFYMTLALYFVCLTGRENHDPTYTLTLPVSRREVVRGRILFACCLEAADLALSALCVWLRFDNRATAWNKNPPVSAESAALAHRFGKLGVWILSEPAELEEALRAFGADIVETTGSLKPGV